MSKKVAWVVGHTEADPGACSPHNLACEFEFNFAIACELSLTRKIGDIFTYDTYKGGYTNMVKRNVKDINAGKYDLVLELHYNAAGPTAHGSEALYNHKATEDWDELRIAQAYVDMMESRMGYRNRGVKHLSSAKDRGYAALYYPKCDALILEPFFGSNKEDCERMRNGYWEYIEILEELTTI